ncbi:MAG: hypothetical protein JNL05_09705 [Flavobacteriales bacterium]|nr:hypothetical protein [Flavobacteriales bacterium]
MVRTKAKTLFFALVTALVLGCSQPTPVPDPVPLAQPLRIERLDQDLFHTPPDSAAGLGLKLQARYGEFFRIYVEQILQGAPVSDPRLPMVLMRFAQDPDWRAAQNAADSVLGDLEPQRRQFEDAFTRLKALFPDSLTPRLVAFNSGYNYGIVPTSDVLAFGVEWFIGPDQPVVKLLAPENFPQYVKDRMRPGMLVPSALKGWLMVHYTRDVQGADLLTNLVETGKVMVLLDAILPEADAADKLAFSPQQLAWCEANEFNVWKSILDEQFLYSRKDEVVARFMNDGPFTNGLPRESPGHIGEWIGLRMVQAYLKENPKVTLPELLAMTDPQPVLRAYKPR